MKRIFFLLLCLCFSVLSFAQRTNETKQLTKQDSLRLQQLLSGQVEILDSFCNNSYHTNMQTMIDGYVTDKFGSRIGIAGEAV